MQIFTPGKSASPNVQQENMKMIYKRYSTDEALLVLFKIEQNRAEGMRVFEACHETGITDTTYYRWRAQYKHLLTDLPRINTHQASPW
jgi:transposase-like protein